MSIQNSSVLQANLPATITCPPNHYAGTTATNGTCRTYSYPLLENNIFWQNSAYYIGVGALSAQYQQNVVSLYNAFTTTLAPTQPQTDATTANGGGVTITGGTGACVAAQLLGHRRARRHWARNHDSGCHARPDLLGADRRHGLSPAYITWDPIRTLPASTATARGLLRSLARPAGPCRRALRTPPCPTPSST